VYQLPQSLLEPSIAFVGIGAGTDVDVGAILLFVVEESRYPPGGLFCQISISSNTRQH
jgi:hypothetical protein